MAIRLTENKQCAKTAKEMSTDTLTDILSCSDWHGLVLGKASFCNAKDAKQYAKDARQRKKQIGDYIQSGPVGR